MSQYIVLSCSESEMDFYARSAFCRCVREVGGVPLLLPALGGEEDLSELCAMASGLLLTGGGDAAPKLYGEEACPFEQANEARDILELRLIRQFRAEGKPILGICRGMQLLNIAFGGSLYRHLAVEGEEYSLPSSACHIGRVEHKGRGTWNEPVHTVRLQGALAAIMGESLSVNSFHHQAVKRMGEGLLCGALAPDGICEGIYAPSGFAIGVQWHPEHMGDLAAKRLFSAFMLAGRRE